MRKMVNVFRNAALLTTICSGVSSLVFAIMYMIIDKTNILLPEGEYTLVDFMYQFTFNARALHMIAHYTQVAIIVLIIAAALYVLFDITKDVMEEKEEAQA